jgi:cysteine desulfurase
VAHVVTTAIEHPAVDQAVRRLERRGVAVTRVPVSAGAAPDELGGLIDEAEASGPWLLAVQWVNHETGTILPLRRWAREARERGARVVVDATQALGKLDVGPLTRDADAVAFAASKVGGPAGAGALWVRRGIDVVPVLAGGAQERGRRPGTLDVVAQAGFAGALADLEARRRAVEVLGAERDRLEAAVERLGGAVNGRAGPRVATVTNASFREWTGELLVAALDVEGVCASSGAACSSGLNEPSPVLAAMYPEEPWRARSALRLSLGPETSAREVTTAIRTLERVLARPTSSEP